MNTENQYDQLRYQNVAKFETMFYTGKSPWHGLGLMVQEAPTSNDALVLADLIGSNPEAILTDDGIPIPDSEANLETNG